MAPGDDRFARARQTGPTSVREPPLGREPEALEARDSCNIGTNLETLVQSVVLGADGLLQELCT